MTVNSGFKERVMAGKYVICDTRLKSAKCKLQLPVQCLIHQPVQDMLIHLMQFVVMW